MVVLTATSRMSVRLHIRKPNNIYVSLVDCCIVFIFTGGEISAAVVNNFKLGGRIALCGAITGYNASDDKGRIAFPDYNALLYKRAKLTGFICLDHLNEIPKAYPEITELYATGKLATPLVDKMHGLENTIVQLRKLCSGKSNGKTMVELY